MNTPALSRRERTQWQYSLSLIRAICQQQSDEALELCRRCGVPVPKERK